ncbi:MAG: ThiF family adenylyltransferase [Holophagaceae bacterium]
MRVSLVLSMELSRKLVGLTDLDVETGGVLFAKPVHSDSGDIRLLARAFHEVPATAYATRKVDQLDIRSDGYVHSLGLAEAEGVVPIWTHTHPGSGSSPLPSIRDQVVDSQISDVFRIRTGSSYYGALILASENGKLTYTGHLDDGSKVTPIDRMIMVGDRISICYDYRSHRPTLDPLYDRNVRAFGGDVQRILGDLRVAVVGCGGTGSAVSEQLVRLGVRDFLLVDPDTLSETNLTRVYGSTPSDVGQPKAAVLRNHLKSIAPKADIINSESSVTVEQTARNLASADIVFGCTDDNAGRLVLSRMATYFLQPVIDCGVLLTSNHAGQLDGIFGRVTTLLPGSACLVCRNRVNLALAANEMLTAEEHLKLVKEGYAPAMPGVEPAVVTFTSAVAAAAVSELLERLTGFGVEPVPTEVILRFHDREISTNHQPPRERHYCHPASGKMGIGITAPLLEQTWKA